jgi:hypothetical protein
LKIIKYIVILLSSLSQYAIAQQKNCLLTKTSVQQFGKIIWSEIITYDKFDNIIQKDNTFDNPLEGSYTKSIKNTYNKNNKLIVSQTLLNGKLINQLSQEFGETGNLVKTINNNQISEVAYAVGSEVKLIKNNQGEIISKEETNKDNLGRTLKFSRYLSDTLEVSQILYNYSSENKTQSIENRDLSAKVFVKNEYTYDSNLNLEKDSEYLNGILNAQTNYTYEGEKLINKARFNKLGKKEYEISYVYNPLGDVEKQTYTSSNGEKSEIKISYDIKRNKILETESDYLGNIFKTTTYEYSCKQ